MIGDEDAAVLVDLQTVRLAVVVREHAPLAGRRDLEDARMCDVDAEQVAVAVERRAFEERMQRPGATMLDPVGMLVGTVKRRRHAGEDFGLDERRRGIHAGTCRAGGRRKLGRWSLAMREGPRGRMAVGDVRPPPFLTSYCM